MAEQMSSDDVINNLPPPPNEQIQTCNDKNKFLQNQKKIKIQQEHVDIVPKYGDSWKETVSILRQRLSLANKMRETALKDGEKLRNTIKTYDKKLEELNGLQQTLEKLEGRYKEITKENHKLRQEIHKTNVEIYDKNNELRKSRNNQSSKSNQQDTITIINEPPINSKQQSDNNPASVEFVATPQQQ
eukprot:126666_1